jgi:hypothetical protein
LLIALLPSVLGGVIGVSGAELNYAGVVVRHDDGELSYGYVGFIEPEISGIELLRRTGLDVVTIAFGGLGEGVCSIDAHGCPSSECRQRVCQGPSNDDPYWQYFRQVSPGDWQPLVLGASSTKVQNGDIDGWSWTPKESGLPPLTLEDVARLAGYNGASFNGVSLGEPGAALHREGDTAADDEQSLAVYLAGGALLLAACGTAGFLAWHRRRMTEGE